MSGSNDASFLVLGDSSWTSIVTQFEITRDMRLNTEERFAQFHTQIDDSHRVLNSLRMIK